MPQLRVVRVWPEALQVCQQAICPVSKSAVLRLALTKKDVSGRKKLALKEGLFQVCSGVKVQKTSRSAIQGSKRVLQNTSSSISELELPPLLPLAPEPLWNGDGLIRLTLPC